MTLGALTENELTRGVAKAREILATVDPARVAAADETLALTFEDHFDYQTLQSREHAAGRIPTDVAQIIYRALGESLSSTNGGWSAGVDTAEKYAITLYLQAVLKRKLGR